MLPVILFASFYAVFNVAGAAIIKHKLLEHSVHTPIEFILFLLDIKIISAVGLIFISMFFSIKALSLGSFSIVIPISTGINFLLTLVLGYLLFKDNLSIIGYLGVLFIIIGVSLISISLSNHAHTF